MDFNSYYKQLLEGNLTPINHFVGVEQNYIDHTVKYIENNFLDPMGKTFNWTLYEAGFDIDAFLSTASTIPFFDNKRIIYFNKTGLLKNLKDEQEDKILEFFKNLPEYVVLILSEPESDGRKKLAKWIKSNATTVEFNKLSAVDFSKWISKRLKQYNISFSQRVLQYFIDRVDYLSSESDKNLYDVDNYLKSLSSLKGEVMPHHIDAYIQVPVEHNIFKMIDSISAGDMSTATQILTQLVSGGEPEIKIFALISGQYRTLYKLKLLLNAGYTPSTAATKLEVHPFVAKKAAAIAPKFTLQMLENIFERLNSTDILLKSTGVDSKWILEKLLLDIGMQKNK